MITLNGQTYAFSDPIVLAVLGGAALILLLFVLIILTLRSSGRSARMAEPLMMQMGALGGRVQALSDGQQQLSGGLHHVSEASAAAQAKLLQLMEARLAEVSRNPGKTRGGAPLKVLSTEV